MAPAEFSKFAGILSVALSQHHILGSEKVQLEAGLHFTIFQNDPVRTTKTSPPYEPTEQEVACNGSPSGKASSRPDVCSFCLFWLNSYSMVIRPPFLLPQAMSHVGAMPGNPGNGFSPRKKHPGHQGEAHYS